MPPRKRPSTPIVRLLEEARYGPQALLNLRDSMPTGAEAAARAESWLRERQVLGIGEVMIVTGRGKGSPDGVPVVREHIVRLLSSLRRRGVVHAFRENGPGGFVVNVAPMSRLLEAPRRNRERASAATGRRKAENPASLEGLGTESLELLRELAGHSLASLGVDATPALIESEMRRQFGILAGSIAPGADREKILRAAIRRALDEHYNG